jgi:hypothetical protein
MAPPTYGNRLREVRIGIDDLMNDTSVGADRLISDLQGLQAQIATSIDVLRHEADGRDLCQETASTVGQSRTSAR